MNNFIEFLYSHFPHRWLNKKAEGTKKLFLGLGKSVDYAEKYVGLLNRNNSVRTADELITDLENEYGLVVNPSLDIEFRRKRIIAKMRMQDSPITKNDLTQMLEMLGLKNCNIYTDYTKFLMTTKFELEDKDYKEISIITNEANKLLHENVRAHIIFNFNAVIKDFFVNENNIFIKNLVLSSYFKNLELDIIRLDNGEKILDGTWNLQAKTKSIELTNLIILGYINSLQKADISANLTYLLKVKNNDENILLSSQFNFFVNNNIFQKIKTENLLIKDFVKSIHKMNISSLKFLMNFENKNKKISVSPQFKSKVKNKLSSSMNNLIINSSIKEKETIESSLTIDTMWYLDDTYNLDNERKLNARKIEISL